jgi:hypothetical protein
MEAAGEFLLDDMSLVSVADPSTNLLANSTFTTGITPWTGAGTQSCRWSQSAGGTFFDEPALHLISTGLGSGGGNAIYADTTAALTTGADYRLTFRYLYVSGSTTLVTRLSQSSDTSGIYWELDVAPGGVVTPGAANIVRRSGVPPLVSHIGRWPIEPTSADRTTIYARVSGSPTGVTLTAYLSGGQQSFPMRDDGSSGDGVAGDGIYGTSLPLQPHDTAVTFTIEAVSAAGSRTTPLRSDPMVRHGYYVNDNQPFSQLPIFHFLVPSTTPASWLRGRGCESYSTFSFAYRGDLHYGVGIRMRGGSVCGATKPYLKVRFHKGHPFRFSGTFEGHKNLNFQSLWTDKSLIRENMAWELLQEMAQPYCTHEFVRIHANGAYFALYAAYERPDSRFLERNGLDPDGNLYKATASTENRDGVYEKKTNELEGSEDLRTFLNTMHDTPAAGLVAFFQAQVVEDNIIEYQASQILFNNCDYPHKNHYLYHDTTAGKWMVTSWDIDLVFGKYWDGTYSGVYCDKMDNPGLTPWYTTNVRGGGTGNHLLDKFFSQGGDYYRRAYLVRLWDALQEKYVSSVYDAKIDFLHDMLYDEQLEDIATWGRTSPSANDPAAPAEFEPNLERVREHIASRRAYLINYLQTTEKFTGHDSLKITEVMYHPLGTTESEYLELWNSTGASIDVSGWTIEGLEPGEARFTFPAGSILARDEIVIVAKDPTAFSSRYGTVGRVFGPYGGNLDDDGEALRVRDDGPKYPATVDYLRYGKRDDWPPEADGHGYSLELTDVRPDRDNDLGINWRAVLGGTPGVIVGITPGQVYFKRGDANSSGGLDLSDAVFVLLHLFKSGRTPACLKSADADGSGVLNVTDPLYILNFLFKGGPLPPAPYPSCGADPTEDELTCETYAPCN